MNWETSTCVKDIQAFIGFTNFYQRFVQGFSKVVAPLIALVRKDILFKWTEECQKSFKLLKERFTTALILAHFDSIKEIIVETDASDWVSAGILSQYSDDNILRPAVVSAVADPAGPSWQCLAGGMAQAMIPRHSDDATRFSAHDQPVR